MPVRQPRRLDRPEGQSLHDRLSLHALSWADFPERVARTEREHPELIVEHEGNLLSALAGEDPMPLLYAFTSGRSFVEHFPGMLERLLPRLRSVGGEQVRFRLAHGTLRPTVEPVLKSLWFEPKRSWLEFSLDRASVPRARLSAGIKVRDAEPGDANEMAVVDREAFPDTPMTAATMGGLIASGEMRGLVARARDGAVGFSLYALYSGGDGYIHTLATSEAWRGHGIGAALVARTAKRLFGEGAQHVRLRTEAENAGAIRFYVRLGFRQTAAGRDYTRPTDPRTIERLKRENQGIMIKFGGWR